jgi:hypothetical protein
MFMTTNCPINPPFSDAILQCKVAGNINEAVYSLVLDILKRYPSRMEEKRKLKGIFKGMENDDDSASETDNDTLCN